MGFRWGIGSSGMIRKCLFLTGADTFQLLLHNWQKAAAAGLGSSSQGQLHHCLHLGQTREIIRQDIQGMELKPGTDLDMLEVFLQTLSAVSHAICTQHAHQGKE